MPKGVLLDNDVILKTCCYAIAGDVLICLEEIGEVSLLGAAHFVLAARIMKASNIANKETARTELSTFLRATAVLEPNDAEVALAADLETEALARGIMLDSGESLLTAMLLSRDSALMITGDKRAIAAIEVVSHALDKAKDATGRIACLEQLLMTLLIRCTPVSVRERICREPAVDRALSICFACSSGRFTMEAIAEGLGSYIGNLRSQAPTVLVVSHDLSAVVA